MTPLIAAFAALAAAQATPPAATTPEAAYLVLSPGPAASEWRTRLEDKARALLVTMHDTGMLRLTPSSLAPKTFAECLSGNPDPEERVEHACLYRNLPRTDRGLPLVAVVVEQTRARGSWQEMTCIGPAGTGRGRIHLRDAFHQRPAIRRHVRENMARCVSKALTGVGAD